MKLPKIISTCSSDYHIIDKVYFKKHRKTCKTYLFPRLSLLDKEVVFSFGPSTEPEKMKFCWYRMESQLREKKQGA